MGNDNTTAVIRRTVIDIDLTVYILARCSDNNIRNYTKQFRVVIRRLCKIDPPFRNCNPV